MLQVIQLVFVTLLSGQKRNHQSSSKLMKKIRENFIDSLDRTLQEE
jgi:hypothetical protein